MANRQEIVCTYIYENYVASGQAVNQQVLVLIGKQGIYKTTWLEHLLPPELRAYGCKMANSTQLNKDERLRIAEYGLIALDEIDAQARYLVEIGFQYWFDMDDIETLEQHNDAFRAQENEEQLLAVYFDIPAEGYGTFMTTAEISDKLVVKGSIKKPMSMVQLGMLLKKSGFQSKQYGSSRTRGWIVRERSIDEVNANRNIEGRTP